MGSEYGMPEGCLRAMQPAAMTKGSPLNYAALDSAARRMCCVLMGAWRRRGILVLIRALHPGKGHP